MAYVSKKQQVINILTDLENTITPRNADIGINILNWAKEKIILAEKESKRQYYLQKDVTNPRNKPRVVKFGKVYGCNLGKNIGSEQNGKSRPVIIAQDTSNCMKSPTVLIMPLTAAFDKNGNKKRKLDTQIEFSHPKMSKLSYIKVEHARCISKARLTEKMCDLDPDTIKDIKEKVKVVYKI